MIRWRGMERNKGQSQKWCGTVTDREAQLESEGMVRNRGPSKKWRVQVTDGESG